MLLDGIHVPLTTPFYPDGRLNLKKLEHNVDRYSRTPAAGMLLTGNQGEASALTDAETREVWEAAIAVAAPEKVMIAGIARDGVLPALELAAHAANLGFDALLLGLPATLAATGNSRLRETLTYFQAIADRSTLPLVLLSDRLRPLGVEAIVELAGHRQIAGIVEASGRAGIVHILREQTSAVRRTATVTPIFAAVTARMLAKHATPASSGTALIGVDSLQGGGTAVATPTLVTAAPMRTREREVGFQVLGGRSTSILADLRSGASGSLPAMAACAPQACFEVLAGWKDGDAGLAEEKQQRLVAASARIEGELGIAGIKYAADFNGYFGGRPRLPFFSVSGAERTEIDGLLQAMRN